MRSLQPSLRSTLASLLAILLAFGATPLIADALVQSAGLTQEQLANATYNSSYIASGAITLTDGQAEAELAPGSASKLVVTLIEPTALGDLDSDGVEDAAVLLATQSGGSGVFIDLHAVLNQDGEPVDMASIYLGDRVQVNSLTIEDGVITVVMVSHGPTDPMCCPAMEQTLTYQLVNGELVQTNASELTLDSLGNQTYTSDDFPGGTVTLVDGAIEIETTPGSATKVRIERTGYAAFGDLNGDGLEDAAVILMSDSGGSGTFYYLVAVVAEEGGGHTSAANILLGDRVIINDLTIQESTITVDLVVHGPEDPLCCPTQHGVHTYVLEGDALILTDEVVVTEEKAVAEFQPEEEPTTATLTLGDGDWLDPTLISIISGGRSEDVLMASTLDAACAGVISARPDIVLDWRGDERIAALRFFLLSLGDPTLVVVTPEGDVRCNDDYSPLMADPYINIDNPTPGRYAIFAGSFEQQAAAPGFLVITSHDLNPAVVDLATLFPRRVNPTAVRNPQPADALAIEDAPQAAAAVPITPESTPYTTTLTAGGSLGAFDVDLGNDICTGFITPTPSFAFAWGGETGGLAVFFEAHADTTLLLRDPEGVFHCNDDLDGADNLNPFLSLTSIAGDYQVWVGSYAPNATVDGVLTITVDADARPTPLTTDMLEQ